MQYIITRRMAAALLAATSAVKAQTPATELLWPEGAPGAAGSEDLDKPALTTYLAPKPNGASVLV